MEVFSRSSRSIGGPADPGEEDNRDAHAKGRVRPARVVERHTSQDGLSKEENRYVLGNCGAVSKHASGQTRGVSFKAGG